MNLSVLRTYRAQLEDRLQAECVELLHALEEALAARARLEADEESQAQAFLTKSTTGIMPAEACDYLASMDALAALIAKTKEQEAALRAALDQKRVEVLEASRERKKIELLEERHEREAQLEEGRRTQQLMDEIAGRRAFKDRDVR